MLSIDQRELIIANDIFDQEEISNIMAHAKVIDVPQKEDENAVDPTKLRKFDILLFNLSDDGARVEILANHSAEEGDEDDLDLTVTFKVYLKKFNESTRKYVKDEETFEKAMEIFKEHFNSSYEELLANNGAGETFTGYTNGDSGYFTPRKPYIRYNKIEATLARELRKNSNGPFLPLRVVENDLYHRFQFGFELEIAGEVQKIRISQLRLEASDENEAEVDVSTKYETKEIASFSEQLNDEHADFSADQRAKLEKAIDTLLEKERARVVNDINEKFGIDLEEMLEKEQTLELERIEVKDVPTNDGPKPYYIVATPVMVED